MSAGDAAKSDRAGWWRDVDGILLLDKPVGITSNAALQRVRRAFCARKAGHTGSLDPLAGGLLPICLGQATKASGLLLDADKTYRVRIQLGARTTTGDAEGEVVERLPVALPDRDEVQRLADSFVGESTQIPPMYSALRQGGKRLYRLARKGVEVERTARRIRIHRMNVLGIGSDWIQLEVACSKGTYVRSLAEDLARRLDTAGHVVSLRRLALGPFDVDAARSLDSVEAESARTGDADAMLLPIDAALAAYPAVRLPAAEVALLLHGRPVIANGPPEARVRIYGADGRFLGVGRMSADGRRLAPERIMIELPHGPALRA